MKNYLLTLVTVWFSLFAPAKAQTVDPVEYATGSLTAQQQLLSYPTPRFRPNHQLNRNFIWFNIGYFSGKQQTGVSNTTMINTAKVNAVEFYTNWNYYFPVTENLGSYATPANYADTVNVLNGALVNIAKRNPTWKTSAISFWAQIGGNVTNKNLSSNHYLRNSAGQFVDLNGNVITNTKYWSPVAPTTSISADGEKQKGYLINLNTALGRPVDILNENGEVIPLISRNGGVLNTDPSVRSEYNSLGYPSTLNTTATNDYRGRKFTDQTMIYKDRVLVASPSTVFTQYGLDGQVDYRPVWSRSKYINSQIKGRYYSTGDFYPRWPTNWRAWAGAWHGLGWFADCKYWEESAGDSLFSPFVCAGWNIDETQNMRPAQYLASLKILSNWGAEFFYSGYFTLSAPFPDSKNWAWQAVMPVYAQAITSRYEQFLYNGRSLQGDVPRYYLSSTTLNPNNPKYLFNTGDNRQLVAVRKMHGEEKYIITTAQMVDSNSPGNAPNVSYGSFKLGSDSIRVEFRRQGSVYYYDRQNQIFYQLDKWHQREHPELWNPDIEIEGEVYDSIVNARLISKNLIQIGNKIDATGVQSAVQLSPNSKVFYSFTGRSPVSSRHYVWVRMRATIPNSVNTVQIQINKVNSIFIPCVSDTNWVWYKSRRWFNNKQKSLVFTTDGNVEIDRLVITQSEDPITSEPFEYCYSVGRFGSILDSQIDIKIIPTLVTNNATLMINTLKDVSGTFIISDILGRVLFTKEIDAFVDDDNVFEIPTSSLISGTYLAIFRHENGITTDRFIKK